MLKRRIIAATGTVLTGLLVTGTLVFAGGDKSHGYGMGWDGEHGQNVQLGLRPFFRCGK